MRKLIQVTSVVLLFTLSGVCQAGSQSSAKEESKPAAPELKLSPEFKEAGSAAADAVGRIPDVKLDDDGYVVRKLDAEKAIDAASHKVSTDDDKQIMKILEAWFALAVKEYDASAQHNMKAFGDAALAGNYCAVEARMVFKPSVLSEKGRQMAAEKKCLSEYQKMQQSAK